MLFAQDAGLAGAVLNLFSGGAAFALGCRHLVTAKIREERWIGCLEVIGGIFGMSNGVILLLTSG